MFGRYQARYWQLILRLKWSVIIFYAHTLAGEPQEKWEPLQEHLDEVERLASCFSNFFGALEWGAILGRCHDLGKGSAAFQDYLIASSPIEAEQAGVENAAPRQKVNHSSFGARYVAKELPGLIGEMLAYCIAGHHAGLPDATSSDDAAQRGTLQTRLSDCELIPPVTFPLTGVSRPAMPFQVGERAEQDFALAFFTRMLFSCLVDADRTCTEQFCEPDRAAERRVKRPSIPEMESALRAHLDRLGTAAAPTEVNRQRAFVLDQCRNASSAVPGFFSLQVPTGGGKTLSSLAFALAHAQTHSLRRIVMAIPFTSIIEQTAEVYRRALGHLAEHGLVEHHTNLQPAHDTRANQFATENWDAPLIVTTNVQLFESLFAASTSPCRKLHRLAGSVIILDEAQMLPVELLVPTLRALRELVLRYGCTVVLCTATQPALQRREDFPEGLEGVRPIIADPVPLFTSLRRVQIVRLPGKQAEAELADRIAAEDRVLAIVNTRAQAAVLFSDVRERADAATCFHLSTLMCGAHRRKVLAEIREQVTMGACRVISTQLVEAGVDLDFPVVYRAEAGFDSIAQAAGRCNREGKLAGLGTTYIFEAEKPPPAGFLRDTAQAARELWARQADPLSPAAIDDYFRHYYWRSADILDKYQVLSSTTIDRRRGRSRFQFREVADKYKLIRRNEVPILVPYDAKSEDYLYHLLGGHVPYVSQRLLQPYLVSVPERTFHSLVGVGVLQLHESGVGLLLRPDAYEADRGLRLEELGLDARLGSM
jgi:CRISPR-associated endonuclease/helicase Cas3